MRHFLGDSTTWGHAFHERKMVKLVERDLNEAYRGRGVRFEAINTGTSSYSNFQYYLLSKEVLPAYAPDLVVLDVDMSDLPNDYYYRTLATFDSSGFPLVVNTGLPGAVALTPFDYRVRSGLERLRDRLVAWSRLVYYADQLVNRGTKQLRPPRAGRGSMAPANWLSLHYTDQIRDNIRESMRLLGRTIELLRRTGAKVVVTGVPHYHQYTGEWSPAPHDVLRETARAHGALYLDSYAALAPEIRGSAPSDFYRENDPTHFNERGNAAWAGVWLDFLLRSGVLP